MARTIPVFITHKILPEAPFTFLIFLTLVFSVFSVVIFLCGSHKRLIESSRGNDSKRTLRLGDSDHRMIKKMKSKLSSKALFMVSWKKSQDKEEEGDEDIHGYNEEENGDIGVIWKKTIIKGDKCQPIDFSGKILYDADGNLLTD